MTSPTRYRKRPVEVDAMEWPGSAVTASPVIQWILDNGGTARYHEEERIKLIPLWPGDDNNFEVIPEHLSIDTLEGTMRALPGDFIIRGVAGEFYSCRPGIFAATYVEVHDG